MAKIFLFHGSSGSPTEHWFGWIRQELEKLGLQVIAPQFPLNERQSLANWQDTFDSYAKLVNRESILVGHSIGAVFALHILQQHPVKAAFFVSGFLQDIGIPRYTPLIKTFIEEQLDWEKIRKNAPLRIAFFSEDDPYISLDHSKKFIRQLQAQERFILHAGHFNAQSGYSTFPQLLAEIKKIISLYP